MPSTKVFVPILPAHGHISFDLSMNIIVKMQCEWMGDLLHCHAHMPALLIIVMLCNE